VGRKKEKKLENVPNKYFELHGVFLLLGREVTKFLKIMVNFLFFHGISVNYELFLLLCRWDVKNSSDWLPLFPRAPPPQLVSVQPDHLPLPPPDPRAAKLLKEKIEKVFFNILWVFYVV
jgi:hypothetical protein